MTDIAVGPGPTVSGPGSGFLQNIEKIFQLDHADDLLAVQDVSFSFDSGEIVSLLGPSGCGKTTVLKMIGGLMSATKGSIHVSEVLVDGPYKNVGMVFQTPTLMPWRNVFSNVTFPAEIIGKLTEEIREKAYHLLELTGLSTFKSAMPNELSGGMQQRVALCGALIHSPEILLMDEPFGALDELTRMEMNDLLLKIQYQEKNTIIFVTHSISEAIYLSDTVIVFSHRPANITKKIKIEINHPRTPDYRYTEEFKLLEQEAGEALGVIK